MIASMTVVSGCSAKANSAWKEKYTELSDEWATKKGIDNLGFELIYLDNDTVPELVMYCYDADWSGFDMYTYKDGDVVHLDTYDMEGNLDNESDDPITSNGRQAMDDIYVSESGIYFQRGGMMGSYWINGYLLEDGKLNRVLRFDYVDLTDWAEDADPVHYDIEYKKKDGSIVKNTVEGEIDFEDSRELEDFEEEYDFEYDDIKQLPAERNFDKLSDDIGDALKALEDSLEEE